MKKIMFVLIGLFVLALSVPAFAHFQMLYTPEIALEKGGKLDFKIVWTHPFADEHTMEMTNPTAFYVLSQRGEGKIKKKDLKSKLKPIKWTGKANAARAYEASVKIRSMGDYVFCFVPGPYYDKGEEAWMQQITKTIVNVGGMPGNWAEPAGLETEIVPLDKPYALWTGNVFRGVVLSEGKPVPDCDIEVEYINHDVLMDKNAFARADYVKAPQDAFVTMTIKANANGEFSFGIPRAGWWGFAALGVGPEKEHKGKKFNADAVIWIKAVDMK
jgi:cobalt/nickel transport protein